MVVGGVVLLVETGGETKVGEFDVAGTVDEDVVGFDVTASITISAYVMIRSSRWMALTGE